MNFPCKVAVKGKGVETLQKNDYKAAGGQGTVCVKNGTAYKIYHDHKNMIPVKKIDELKPLLPIDNILGPQNLLLDPKTNIPIGFTMKFVDKSEFLCRLFNKSFKQDNSISPDMVMEMVKVMQKTISLIHKEKILIVDLNEMNLLTDDHYTNIFFIDVDSYQTPSFKATALMESIRDRVSPKGQFTELTDWFSFAIVSFQLYMGFHPYRKGRHKDYMPKDWSERMDKSVSVFHPDVDLDDMWKTWDVIPKPHLDWYKRVFHDKERSIPPLPDGIVPMAVIKPIMVAGNNSFEVTLIKDFKEKILGAFFFNGLRHVMTEKSLYSGNNVIYSFVYKGRRYSLAQVMGFEPVLAYRDGLILKFEAIDGSEVGNITADDAMSYGGGIYSIHNGKMIENSFQFFGKKTIHFAREVANVFQPATKLYPGVAVQDILGTCWLAIPYKTGFCSTCRVKELDGYRVIDAKFENGICIVSAELEGAYSKFILCFNDSCSQYTCRIEGDPDDFKVNFTVLKNGVCAHIPGDDRIEVFKDNTKINVVKDPPFTTDMRLVNDSTSIMFVDGNKLYGVKLK